MFTPKRKQLSRYGSGGARELQRRMSVVSIFILLARAAGQDVGGNAATNQPGAQIVSTNPAPIQNIETPSPPPAGINQLEAPNALTNQAGVTPSQPPPLGPATIGSAQPASPIMGPALFPGRPAHRSRFRTGDSAVGAHRYPSPLALHLPLRQPCPSPTRTTVANRGQYGCSRVSS